MAFAFSECVPCRRGEPRLHFIRVAVRSRKGPLPQPPPPGPLWALTPSRRPHRTGTRASRREALTPGELDQDSGPGDTAAARAPGRGVHRTYPARAGLAYVTRVGHAEELADLCARLDL